ncbi:MAG TPA: SDR family oxidoreductase, partial [Candidatus Polarisedimenticolia bacterium]|nr:SDR family oxidoreductase [Candidatus Polarisedimenticolia bacterium]
RRIGRALAIALAEEGVNIVAHDHMTLETETAKVCGEVEDCGARSWKVMADLEKPEEYEPLLARALQTAGSLDILINNASIFFPGTLMDIGYGDLMRHMHINAWTPFVLSREFARLVRRGTIINLLDTKIAGHDREHAAYILSKHMLSILTRMCALEFAPDVTVNAVAPGLILPPAGKDESYLDRLAEKVPLRKHGGPGDIADAAIYLLKSDFVTGQIIFVDGGRHLLGGGNGPDTD